MLWYLSWSSCSKLDEHIYLYTFMYINCPEAPVLLANDYSGELIIFFYVYILFHFCSCLLSVLQIWIQPEGKQLCHVFSNLRKLFINGIYVEFDLLWTINLLEAAPSVEIFGVEVYKPFLV